MEVGQEVVYGLRENTRPVDRINCAKSVSSIEVAVSKKRLDYVLIIDAMRKTKDGIRRYILGSRQTFL